MTNVDFEVLFDIIENDFHYKKTDSGILVTISTADGKEDVSINSDKFISIITSKYRKRCGMVISPTPIKNCIRSFQGDIVIQQEKAKNPNRYIHRNHEIWIDTANRGDTYFVIKNKQFPLSMRLKAYKHFYKHSKKSVIPLPDMEHADINRIFKYCRVPESERAVFIAYLVTLLIGDIEHPCLVINGEQGSGKTTMCIFIKALIDPIGDNRPNLCPRKDSEWVLLFQENYLIAIDNLATISSSTSDTLCGYVTGIKERRRKLYTDNETIDYDICQPIILNGIHDVIRNEDMLSRSIVLTLEKPANGESISDEKVSLMEEFKKDCPAIWGGMVNLLSEALSSYEPYIADRYGRDIRMPAFYDYGYCICEAWEKGQGEAFCKRYGALLDSQLKQFEKNPDLVEVVVFFLERHKYEWESTMQFFSNKLNGFVALADADIKIPSAPNRLSREINNLRFELKRAGVIVEMNKTPSNSRYIRLTLEKTD
ncbi:MAG: hypothetical protein NC420_06510 [Eubacterium sp.]|nr:hypothetical protein [Eubacterium sp.]